MATINGRRVCWVDGGWQDYEDIIAKTSDRILGLLSTGPKTRRYFGLVLACDAKFIDGALRRLSRAGRVAASAGPVLRCRLGRTWAVVD